MTLPLVEGTWKIRPVEGPDYTVGPRCANPNCTSWVDDVHHLWRRSGGFGPIDWVEIDGQVVANKTGLCRSCHRDLTGGIGGYKAAIRLTEGQFMWCLIGPPDSLGRLTYLPVAPIEPQPPTPETVAPPSGHSTESVACPTCGHVKRARPSGRGRARKSWTIKVPDDAENGAEILDTLVDDLGLILGIEPNVTGRYFIVLPCVYYAHQEKARFVESLKGSGG